MRACAVCLDWYAWRGPYSGRLNVLIIVAVVYENSGGGVGAINRDNSGGGHSTESENTRFLDSGYQGVEYSWMENENTRFLDLECHDVEYFRLRTRTLVSWIRSVRIKLVLAVNGRAAVRRVYSWRSAWGG